MPTASPNSITPAAKAPLPPLPNLPTSNGAVGGTNPMDPMAQLLSGVMPIKQGVDGIMAACQQIVQSGMVPGAEQICSQIMQLASSLLPMAAQSALQPGAMQQPGMSPMPQGGGMVPPEMGIAP